MMSANPSPLTSPAVLAERPNSAFVWPPTAVQKGSEEGAPAGCAWAAPAHLAQNHRVMAKENLAVFRRSRRIGKLGQAIAVGECLPALRSAAQKSLLPHTWPGAGPALRAPGGATFFGV
jgi:hypothetical protein